MAFTSTATNLDPGDTDTTNDVYVKNLVTGDITLASTSDDGTKANAQSLNPHLSADGTTVAFEGYATNLDPGDAEGLPDIYVKNLLTGDISLASTSDAGVKGNGISLEPSLSGDGTKVAFSTDAALDPSDTNSLIDVYVKDVVTGDVVLASTSDSGAQANANTGTAVLSADGTKVLFTSGAWNLDAADGDSIGDVFVKDLVSGDVTLASRPAVGPKGNGGSIGASLSADGTRVAFASRATNLHPADDHGTSDVYVKDLTTGALTLASVSDGGTKGNGESAGVVGLAASLSADGTSVAFMSLSTNLDPADADAIEDIYVKDLDTGDIVLASTSATGVKSDLQSFNPSLSSDGSKVAFSSRATNLHPADQDPFPRFDVFLKELAVHAPNEPPVAGDDSITVPESGSHTFEARANDSPGPPNEGAQTLAVQAITQAPAHGTASVAADGRIVYAPTPGFDGADGFSYRVCDDGATAGAPDPRCDEAAVTVDIESFEEQLEEIIDTSPGPVSDKVEDALEKIRIAEQKLAQTPSDRQGALGEYEGAVGEIAAAVRDGLLPGAVGRSLMDRICASARKVAEDAISEAEARGGDASKIAGARRSRDDGDARRSAGRFKDAVARYKDAVSKAEGA